jgi:hypothetical protein
MIRWPIRSSFVACATLLCAAAGALAGPLNRALVDREATWVVHMDVEAAARSSLSGWAVKNASPAGIAKIEECKKKFGMAPIDFKGVTIYGLDLQDDGVAVLTTTGEADALSVKLPEAGLEEFKARVDGNVHYFTFKLEGKTWYLAVRPSGPQERLVLVAASGASLERGLKVIQGSTPNLMADAAAINNVVATAQPDKGSLAFIAMRNVSGQRNMNANILQNTKTLVIDIGESAGANGQEFFGTVLVTAQNSKVAQELGQALQGMIALGTMLARNNEIPGVVETLRAVNLTVREDEVTLTSREKSELVLKKLDTLKVMIEQEMADGERRRSVKVASEKPDDAAATEQKSADERPADTKGPTPKQP